MDLYLSLTVILCPIWRNLSRYVGVYLIDSKEWKKDWIHICLLPGSCPIWLNLSWYVGVYLMEYQLVRNQKHYHSRNLQTPHIFIFIVATNNHKIQLIKLQSIIRNNYYLWRKTLKSYSYCFLLLLTKVLTIQCSLILIAFYCYWRRCWLYSVYRL